MTTTIREQFTASEVRRTAAAIEGKQMLVSSMLRAYADLLEAQEKAVPVYQHRSKNGPMFRWFDCSEETFMAMEHNEHDKEHFDRRILYTHPASADAERLAEALLRNWFNLLCHAGIDAREEKANSTLHRIMDIAKQVSSEIAKYENVAQAQPPAASVTDAMVQRAFDKLLADGLDDLDRPKIEGMRAALEAALAAQENPNG